MAHIPLIHGPDGAKLSKRHGALGVDAYRAMGYLPAAMRNYLVRLGWSHGDQEIFSTEEMIAAFDLPQIGRSPARFDFAKLESLNGHYMRQTRRRRAGGRDRARCCRISPDGAELAAKLTPELREQAGRRHAGAEGARQDAGRADRRAPSYLFADRPLALDDKARGAARRPRRARCSASSPANLAASSRWTRRDHRGGGARLRRAQGRQARRGRAAAARGADRPHHLAADLRRAGGARAKTKASARLRDQAVDALRPTARRADACTARFAGSIRGLLAAASCSAHSDGLREYRMP